MNAIATEILLESKTARDGQLTQVSHEAASDVLSKAKALVFALWQGTGAATTQEMAEYYEVPEDTVQKVHQRNRAELLLDGVKTIKGKELREVRDILSTSQERLPSLTIWTPRAALRLGMLLRDSDVAKQVRTVLLDVAENGGDRISEPEPQPLPTQAELTAMLAQETVKLEKKVNVLIETAAEHDRAISELQKKAAARSEPTAARLTTKELLALEKEQIKLETEQFRLEVERERNWGRELLLIQAKKRTTHASQPSKRPTLTLVTETESSLAPNLAKILELAKRQGGTITVRDISISFDSKYRPTTQQIREWFQELVAMNYGEISVKGRSIKFCTSTSSTSPTTS